MASLNPTRLASAPITAYRAEAPTGNDEALDRVEPLGQATRRVYTYLAIGLIWYVKKIPGPPARPLDLPKPRQPMDMAPPSVPRGLTPFTNAAWAREKPIYVALGAGFVGGLYRHLGLLIAFQDAEIEIGGLAGASAGAIVAAMCGALPLRGPNSVEEGLMSLHPQDFLDPELAVLRQQGAICSGKALERKLARTLASSGKTDLQEMSPPVRVELYNADTGETVMRDKGSIVRALRQSASLPALFAPVKYDDEDVFIDGGVVDQNCVLGMPAGERAVNHRVYDTEGPDLVQRFLYWRLGRPGMVLTPSADPDHRTLHFPPEEKITERNFITALQDNAMLKRITDHTRTSTMAWLAQPAFAASQTQGHHADTEPTLAT